MWPFKSKPKYKFAVGERVRLIDSAMWTNPANRHLIGRDAVVVGVPKGHDWWFPIRDLPPTPVQGCQYQVEVEGWSTPNAGNVLFLHECCMSRDRPHIDPFEEPRDLTDDTPNKVVDWDNVPAWKPPVTA